MWELILDDFILELIHINSSTKTVADAPSCHKIEILNITYFNELEYTLES